ncbi:hydroxyisourate hydrolase [Kribbella sp. CA-253562]|uniref:hydroxyisourate hydrolase n=1 Tax=Kribbella sp. CA-253562 TaxID=3239942 RepID=UPI003D8BB8E3
MSTVSTHVLDTGLGRPARGVPVRLSRIADERPGDRAAELVVELGSGWTDEDGRIKDLTPHGLAPGTYQLRFDVAAYATASGQEMFFPEVTVTFTITDERHHHVPLLLSPFAYSTYRGS